MNDLDCCNYLPQKLGRPCLYQNQSVIDHCTAGMHCISTTSQCAFENGSNDHPNQCCDCKSTLLIYE